MSSEITSPVQGAQGFVQHGCAPVCAQWHWATFPQFVLTCNHGDNTGFVCYTLYRLPSALLVFSPGFHLVFLSLKFMVSTLLLHSKNAFDKRIIILFESRIVLMLKWVFVCGQEGKETTLMLSLFLYWSSLELWWVGIQHFPTAAFLLNENPIQVIFQHLTCSTF